ncbi:hypothetical protein Pint_07615 [Pistacia integerrima]|uniref:Uncharacterized protein n=1 Tax=Pistacia integerrima TaxID=434235 RepID=A0ACC0XVT4_9ROSI|nr:hypothetical protein Pint_07615 [Pistacia integerrima]
MDSANSKASKGVSAPSQSSSKRLLFDRRYGWVFDEWKDPSEEALAGGRGMFCILPIAKAVLKTASDSSFAFSFPTLVFMNLAFNHSASALHSAYLFSCFHMLPKLNFINLAASSAVEVFERPELLSPQSLKASFNGWIHNISSFVQKPEFNRLAVKGNSTSDSIIYSSHLHIGNRE